MVRYRTFLLALGLFALALAVRLPGLDTFFTADEFLWVDRSHDFLGGLLSSDYACLLPDETETNALPGEGLACTLRTGHPGVLTMWTGAAGITLNWLTEPADDSRTLLAFVRDLPTDPVEREIIAPVRLPTVIITSLFVAVFFLLLGKLFTLEIAFLGALLLALNPFHIALSRVLHHDALSTCFIISSALATIIYFGVARERRWLMLAGVLAGVAMLSKSTGFFLIPYTGLIALYALGAQWARGEQSFGLALGQTILDGLLWTITVIFSFSLFWPAMWVIPGKALYTIYAVGFKYASGGHAKGVLFFDTISKDPGPLFYPVMWFFRTNLWSMVGVFLAIGLGMHKLRQRIRQGGQITSSRLKGWFDNLSPHGFNDKTGLLLWVGSFLFFFLVAMTLGEKKQDRYTLPLYPMLDLVAAVGLWVVVQPRQLVLRYGLIGLVMATNLGLIAWHVPYYFTYYNPLVGGIDVAAEEVTIGWGEGLNEAATFLNAKPNSETLKVSSWYGSTFAPYFKGETIRYSDQKGNALAGDYIVFYVNQLQRHFPDDEIWRYFNENFSREQTISLNGVAYAWIYGGKGIEHYVEDQTYKGIGSLLGWDWLGVANPDEGPVSAGEILSFALFWEYLGKVPEETFFVRLIGQDGNIWAEGVSHPTVQFAEATNWREGQIIEEAGILAIPPTTPPGEYTLQIGFYTSAPAVTTGELFFPIPTSSAQSPLQRIEVKPGQANLPIDGKPMADLMLLSTEDTVEIALEDDKLGFDLVWAVITPTVQIYKAGFVLLDEAEIVRWTWPAQELISFLPTTEWPILYPIQSRWGLPLDNPRIPGGNYTLQLRLFTEAGPQAAFNLGQINLPGRVRNFEKPQPQTELMISLEGGVVLLGADIPNEALNPEKLLEVTLYWKSEIPLKNDYTVFMQLLGPNGQVLAQQDAQPLAGNAPTSTWAPGEVLVDVYALELPTNLPEEGYQLITGMYNLKTGERLKTKQNNGDNNFITLKQIDTEDKK